MERTERQRWMAVLARADGAELSTLLRGVEVGVYERVRGPELGLVMVRGRAGGSGAAFNLGEATVARCTVRDAAGFVGHAYCLGQDLRRAELAAVCDAALQDAVRHGAVMAVVERLAAAQAARREGVARRAAATQVQFFTLATMRS